MNEVIEAIHKSDIRKFHEILAINGMPCYPMDYKILQKCLQYRRYDMARLLIQNGCNVDVDHYCGNSPLHLAVRENEYDLVESLLRQGAVVTRIDPSGNTALHLAFEQCDNERIVDLLMYAHLHNSTRNETSASGMTFLHIAATRPELGFIQCFIEDGKANVNCQVHMDTDSMYAGYTPLHMAVEFGRFEVAERLLTYGADVYAQDIRGTTPLHLALERRAEDFMTLLFSYDTKRVNCVNKYGLSHFMAACACDQPDIAIEFLDNLAKGKTNFNVNARVMSSPSYPFMGFTPIHFAVEYGRSDIVRLLLDHGASSIAVSDVLVLQNVADKNQFYDIACLIDYHEPVDDSDLEFS